jgi:hypothetical protein
MYTDHSAHPPDVVTLKSQFFFTTRLITPKHQRNQNFFIHESLSPPQPAEAACHVELQSIDSA